MIRLLAFLIVLNFNAQASDSSNDYRCWEWLPTVKQWLRHPRKTYQLRENACTEENKERCKLIETLEEDHETLKDASFSVLGVLGGLRPQPPVYYALSSRSSVRPVDPPFDIFGTWAATAPPIRSRRNYGAISVESKIRSQQVEAYQRAFELWNQRQNAGKDDESALADIAQLGNDFWEAHLGFTPSVYDRDKLNSLYQLLSLAAGWVEEQLNFIRTLANESPASYYLADAPNRLKRRAMKRLAKFVTFHWAQPFRVARTAKHLEDRKAILLAEQLLKDGTLLLSIRQQLKRYLEYLVVYGLSVRTGFSQEVKSVLSGFNTLSRYPSQ